jgi:ABC-2 type transport system permease protein
MPTWMQKLSFLIPVTYSLDALRMTILRGSSIAAVSKPIAILVVMSLILLPSSIAIFASVVRKARREGTLMQY